jgi:hypothetical protein
MNNALLLRMDRVTLSALACIASLVAIAAPGCGSTTCSTSVDCSDAEYCPQEEGACLLAVVPEHSCVARPAECPKVLSPVCGCDDKTYDNACLAAVAGVSVATVGACIETCAGCTRDEYCSSELGACGQGTTCLARPESCPPTVAPVCGCDGETYNNECEAQRGGTSVASEGACPGPEATACGGPADTTCPEGYTCQLAVGGCLEADPIGQCRVLPTEEECDAVNNPVCGCDGQTYRSACAATLAGVSVEVDGPCPCGPGLSSCPDGQFCSFEVGACADAAPVGTCVNVPPTCPDIDAPVCGCDGNKYQSACAAASASVNVAVEGGCPCGPTIGDCAGGQFCNFPAGTCGDPEPVGTCEVVPNDCPDLVVPVCGCDGEDYPSACEAARDGFSIRVVGPCEPEAAEAGAGGG